MVVFTPGIASKRIERSKQRARRPSMPANRPNPDSFTPPKGRLWEGFERIEMKE